MKRTFDDLPEVIKNRIVSEFAKQDGRTYENALARVREEVNAPKYNDIYPNSYYLFKDFYDGKIDGSQLINKIIINGAANNRISTEKSNNRVSHPNYYKLPNGVECKDVIQYFDWNIGSAIKYCWRNGKKPEEGMTNVEKAIEDLHKAIECIQFEIELLRKNAEVL